jgi:N-acetylmuramoyl-L-alanine amidase
MREIVVGRRRLFRLAALGLGAFAAGSLGGPASARLWPKRKPFYRRLPTVVLDPGHGGSDPGAIGPHGVYEKEITLATARRLWRLLRASRRFRVSMTRRGDQFLSLDERVRFARARRADLFLSIHADDLPDPAMRGASVYTLSAQASDRVAAALAKSENRGERVGGIDLGREPRDVAAALLDLAREETRNLSIRFADDLVASLARAVPLLERPLRSAGFVVLSAPDIPSSLVELGCLSNAIENRLLTERAHQTLLARALFVAIEHYSAHGTAV